MYCINDRDLEYILNKYHDTGKEFDPFHRFIRNDAIFDESAGMDGEQIIKNILALDEKNRNLPHPVRKALAFAYVLENTRISCDCRDRFPAINMVDRPLNKTIITKWHKEVFEGTIPEVEKTRRFLEDTGIATCWPDYDHSVPIWERVFSLGFRGLLEDSERARVRLAEKNKLTAEQAAFFDGIKITYGAITAFLGRLAELASKTAGSERLAAALCHLRDHPPETFYQALLANYIYFMLSEHIEGLQVRSLSNFDRIFYPFYRSDLDNGVSEGEIRADLAYYFLQFTAIGNYWNQPVFFGGTKADGTSEINELSFLALDVYNKMGIYNPKIQIKVGENTPKEFVMKALDMIRRGNNSIVLVSDECMQRALMNIGVTREQAKLCNVTGCYEYSIQGSICYGMNYVNLIKPLEFALHRGCDGITGEFVSIKTPDCYPTFDDLYREYKRQLCFIIDRVMETVNAFEDYLAIVNPQSMLSATYPSCLEAGKDALAGGAVRNDSIMLFGYLANLADSMAAIRHFVYDTKSITLNKLVEILDSNFEGNEIWQRNLYQYPEKYGNNKPFPDEIAADIVKFLTSYVCGRPNSKVRGGTWNCSFHVARQSYDQGRLTMATPDGRRRGEELSKNISPSMGQARNGVTAAILSATKIDAGSFTGDACLDVALLPSATTGDDGLEAMYALLMTYFRKGGHAMHINVFDANMLREAQKRPEKYQDLQIRVCGWNVLFNNISREEQDAFIKQAEALA
ncbi:MAG: hypothetical protein GX172_06220 [Clostridiales bacterium]|jgi:pyruvate-formate lyase|nr:hypothetical protein [Clostridiales bacterium]